VEEDRLRMVNSVITIFCITLILAVLSVPLGIKIINYIGTDAVRVRGGQVQTPVVTFQHPETKREIIFVGTMHMALPAYYKELQEIIDSHESSIVLYEGGAKRDWQRLQSDPAPEEKKSLRWLYDREDQEDTNTRVLGLQNQSDGLRYEDDWQSNDLTPTEVIRLGLEYGYIPDQETGTDTSKVNERILGKSLNHALINMPLIFRLSAINRFFSDEERDRQHFIETIRNDTAVEMIFDCAKEKDVVTIWGAQHIIGFGKAFRQHGYVEIDRSWHTGYRNQKFPDPETEVQPETQDP
jgi:hypothetical protein